MILSIIVALGRNNEIGKDNTLLCYLPADLKHFKKLTLGHTILMGRKTFESLPNGTLPNRKNIIISRNRNLKIENAEVNNSLDDTLQKLIEEKEVFIIGGYQIYQQTLPLVNKLYLTKIHADFPEADVFFPFVNYNEWIEISQETYSADKQNSYSYSFVEYERRI